MKKNSNGLMIVVCQFLLGKVLHYEKNELREPERECQFLLGKVLPSTLMKY